MLELLAAGSVEAPPSSYFWVKWLHVLGMVVYAGGFLALTRLMGHAVRFESAQSRVDAYRIFKRMHKFVDWGGLAIVLLTGLHLAFADPVGKEYFSHGYFHVKLNFVVVIIVCDVLLSRKLFKIDPEGPQPSATFFRILHGVAALAVLGALFSVFVLRG